VGVVTGKTAFFDRFMKKAGLVKLGLGFYMAGQTKLVIGRVE
jgi:hypothetical protein